ncbi:hypothetical protein K466DRAFT_147471 [Polyporus arcularius HHB13444]|uniref:Uncharacterized protein n=1 Tax=Polyporus arcularius HHB13444 TaxID=1314778 RepID=A0A5C3PDB9_9APHY|nr:hypothetical protein K466DRAFT_147471 [Polyporus arcularius HHB13444]
MHPVCAVTQSFIRSSVMHHVSPSMSVPRRNNPFATSLGRLDVPVSRHSSPPPQGQRPRRAMCEGLTWKSVSITMMPLHDHRIEPPISGLSIPHNNPLSPASCGTGEPAVGLSSSCFPAKYTARCASGSRSKCPCRPAVDIRWRHPTVRCLLDPGARSCHVGHNRSLGERFSLVRQTRRRSGIS